MPRILAVDPGEVRIGLAVCDPTGTIARPLKILKHTSRETDAESILASARETAAERIVVGVAFDVEGAAGPQARRALRLVKALKGQTSIPVETWDESGSTQAAHRSRRAGPDDARAAAVILQEYLDAQKP